MSMRPNWNSCKSTDFIRAEVYPAPTWRAVMVNYPSDTELLLGELV